MKRLLWLSIAVSQSFLWSAQENFEQEILRLPERSVNLVVLNDTSENYAKKNKLCVWHDISGETAIAYELLSALIDNQIVLCSKSLWLEIQFLVAMWNDMAIMNYERFYQKYHTFIDMNSQTQRDFVAVQPFVKKLQKLRFDLNQASQKAAQDFAQNVKSVAAINVDFDKKCNSATSFMMDASSASTVAHFSRIFTIDTWYQVLVLSSYECRAVGNDYLLFVPTSLIELFQERSKIFNPIIAAFQSDKLQEAKKSLTSLDLLLGLNYSSLPTYNYKERLSAEDSYEFMKKTSGQNLLQALQSCLIDRRLIKKDYLDYIFKILPNFNVYLSGHGSAGQGSGNGTIAEMSYDDFIKLLHLLNKQIRTKNFLFGSCFANGTSVQSLFQRSYLYHKPSLSSVSYPTSLSYPIMFLGTMKNKVSGVGRLVNLSKVCEEFDVYENQVFAPHNESYFSTMFDLLDQEPLPNYLDAMKTFSSMFEDSGSLRYSHINNYVCIKFPHADWIEPFNFGKFVKKITKISVAASSKDIVIDKNVKIVLLAANNIDKKIILRDINRDLMFLPITYKQNNLDFYIDNLEMIEDVSSASLQAKQFTDDQALHVACKELDSLFLKNLKGSVKDKVFIVISQANILGIKLNKIICDLSLQEIAFNISLLGGEKSYAFKVENYPSKKFTVLADYLKRPLQKECANIIEKFKNPKIFSSTDNYKSSRYELDFDTTFPPKKLFINSLEEKLQKVPKLVEQSRQLQQSWTEKKQKEELYDTRKPVLEASTPQKELYKPKAVLKELNPDAKSFTPKGIQL